MNSDYLIPANSKRSMLIFGLFTGLDLGIFLGGLGVTLIMLMFLEVGNIVATIITLSPAFICGFLVMPIPNYHNMRTILKSIFIFYTTRQRFVWKGWCFADDEENVKEQIYK